MARLLCGDFAVTVSLLRSDFVITLRAGIVDLLAAEKYRAADKECDKVAAVLAELDEGTAPSTIARKVGVGYAAVARIAETTKRLQRAGTG